MNIQRRATCPRAGDATLRRPRGILVIGGLGGGGDVALSLMLARAMGVEDEDLVVASFLNCSVARGRLRDLAVEGSLIRVTTGYFMDRRVFEDKLSLVAPGLEGRVYGVCTRDPWESMVRGLKRLIRDYEPTCMLHSDIGGDALLLGYEDRLGSYKTDTVARALLAEAVEWRVKSIIAIGCLGCEGGGAELDMEWLAADVAYTAEQGALLGVLGGTLPTGEAEALLGLAESGMLPYLLAALRGQRRARIDMAYLHGEYPVEPWHRLVFILDAERHCSLSPLCATARGQGARALRGYSRRRPTPPRNLARMLGEAKRHGAAALLERIVKAKRLSQAVLRRFCGLD